VTYSFLYLSTFVARGTILNNNVAFNTAIITDRVQQYGQNALHHVIAACNSSLLIQENCSHAEKTATKVVHLDAEELFMTFVQKTRPDIYYTPITVRFVLDSLLDRMAAAWKAEGVQVPLDQRRVAAPAALMQELLLHPGGFLSAVCEAINRT